MDSVFFSVGCCRCRVGLVLHTRDPGSGRLGFEMAFSVCLVKQSQKMKPATTMTRYSKCRSFPAVVVPPSRDRRRDTTHVACVSISLASHDDHPTLPLDFWVTRVGGACTAPSPSGLPSKHLPFSVSHGASARPALLLERCRTGNGSEQGG